MKSNSWKAGDHMRKKKQERPGRPSSLNRPVIAIDKDTGEEQRFDNYRDAAVKLKANRGVIFLCLDGVRRSHMGYEFYYASDGR